MLGTVFHYVVTLAFLTFGRSNESLRKVLAGPDGECTTLTYLLAGSGAGAVAAAATTPLDMVKTRLQTQHMGAAASPGSAPMSSPSQQPRKIGLRGPAAPFRRGLQLRNAMTAALASSASPPGPGEPVLNQSPRLTGVLDAVSSIYREGGVQLFFRGVVPRLLVATPSVAIRSVPHHFPTAIPRWHSLASDTTFVSASLRVGHSWTAYESAKVFLSSRL